MINNVFLKWCLFSQNAINNQKSLCIAYLIMIRYMITFTDHRLILK